MERSVVYEFVLNMSLENQTMRLQLSGMLMMVGIKLSKLEDPISGFIKALRAQHVSRS
jgi:hypothetical protein